MSAIYERAAVNLFANTGDRNVTVSFIELLGDKLFDMLKEGRRASHDWHGRCCVSVPVRQVHAKDAKELLLMLEMAGKLRATAAQKMWLALSTRTTALSGSCVDSLRRHGFVLLSHYLAPCCK